MAEPYCHPPSYFLEFVRQDRDRESVLFYGLWAMGLGSPVWYTSYWASSISPVSRAHVKYDGQLDSVYSVYCFVAFVLQSPTNFH